MATDSPRNLTASLYSLALTMGSIPSSIPLTKFHYFLSLPEDLRYEIYSYFFPHSTINITLPKRKNGRVPHYFKYFFHVEGIPLLTLNKQIFEECKDFLWTRNKFTSKDALTFNALPDVMGGAVTNIKHVELKNHFRMVVGSQQQWPKMMRLLSENFKSLSTFELYADFGATQPPLAETSGTDRVRQEVRALARFGAFLVIRIPQLSFLVIEKPYTLHGRTYSRVKVMQEAPRLKEGETILNSRALRHSATWDELHDLSIKHFEIDPRCPTSEMASYGLLPKDMEKIDTIGYQTRGELYLKNIHQTPDVDTMIAAGRKNILDHECMAQETRERKKNTETTLGKIAELFQKGLSVPTEDKKKVKREVQNDRGGMFQSKPDRNTQINLPKNTQRTIPSNFLDIKSAPAHGRSNNWRGNRGRGRNGGRGGAHAPPGAEGRWQGNGTRPSITDKQHVPKTLTNGEAAQGAAVNDNGDWPALGSMSSRRRRRAVGLENPARLDSTTLPCV